MPLLSLPGSPSPDGRPWPSAGGSAGRVRNICTRMYGGPWGSREPPGALSRLRAWGGRGGSGRPTPNRAPGRRSSEDPGASSCAPRAWEPQARAQVCPGGGSGVSLVSSQGALGKHSGVWLPVSLLPGTRAGRGGPACGPAEPAVHSPEPLSPAPLRRRVRIFCLASRLPSLRLQADPLLSWPGARPPAAKSRVGAAGASHTPGRDPPCGGSTHGLVPTRVACP